MLGRSGGSLARCALGSGADDADDGAAHGGEQAARGFARRGAGAARDDEVGGAIADACAASGGNNAAGTSTASGSVTTGEARAGTDGADGGATTSTRSMVGGCDVELPTFCEANNEAMYCAQPVPYSSAVDGGAGPHDFTSTAPHDSKNVGASAAARRRQKIWCASCSGSAPPLVAQ